MVEFMAYTGLRAGEVTGLEVEDVVFTPAPVTPGVNTSRAAVQVRRTKDRKGGQWVTGTLKSKRSRRTVPLPAWLAAEMADYLAGTHPRAAEPTAPLWPSRTYGGGYRREGERYAVPFDWAQPLALGSFYDTIMKPALEAIGLPASRPAARDGYRPGATRYRGVRLHDLRHRAAVLYLSAGMHFMRVSQLLGHAMYTLTLDTYGDYIPQDDHGPAPELAEPPAPTHRAGTATVVPLRRTHGA